MSWITADRSVYQCSFPVLVTFKQLKLLACFSKIWYTKPSFVFKFMNKVGPLTLIYSVPNNIIQHYLNTLCIHGPICQMNIDIDIIQLACLACIFRVSSVSHSVYSILVIQRTIIFSQIHLLNTEQKNAISVIYAGEAVTFIAFSLMK